MVGATPAPITVMEKTLVLLPAVLVAVTLIEVVASASGVPVSSPELDKLAQLGKPVALQVIPAVPVAANWKE